MPVIPRRPKVKFRFRSSRDRQSRSRGFGWSEFILEYALASCSRGTESPMSMAAGAAIGHPSMRLAVFKNSADRLKAVLQTFRYPGRQLLVVPASAGSLPGKQSARTVLFRVDIMLPCNAAADQDVSARTAPQADPSAPVRTRCSLHYM